MGCKKKVGVSITYQSDTIFATFAPFAVNREKAHRKDREGRKVKGSMNIPDGMKLQNTFSNFRIKIQHHCRLLIFRILRNIEYIPGLFLYIRISIRIGNQPLAFFN